MIVNGKDIRLTNTSLQHLQILNRSTDIFMFKNFGDEPFEPSFRADPKQFNKLINSMVDFKRELTQFFNKQYHNRNLLINLYQVRADEYQDYLFPDQWNPYQEELAGIIEKHTSNGFDLGAIALAIALGISLDFSSADKQQQLTNNAIKSSQTITNTTQARAIAQVKASLALNEDRAALEARLQKVFLNPYRGRFIAQQETLGSYMDGKYGAAVDTGLDEKTALSSQALDSICGDVNGETVPINQPFSNGFMLPLFHFGCRCDVQFSRSSQN